jgi:hypothetical protein
VKNTVQAELVKRILERADQFPWTIQGLGMMRLYLGKMGRIHIWDARIRVPNVSVIHTHFWHLKSTILSGAICNKRYEIATTAEDKDWGLPMKRQRIVTGEGGGLIGDPEVVRLYQRHPPEFYESGDCYEQQGFEIHETSFQSGTVTLLERPLGKQGEETAYVFWPAAEEWVSAEPRPATPNEMNMVAQHALSRWVYE